MMVISKNNQKISSIDDWLRIAPPQLPNQWRSGRSAMEFARSWFPVPGKPIIPKELINLFVDTPLAGITFLDGEPEAHLTFDNIRMARHSDLAARAQVAGSLVAINIEAKADEAFDKKVGKRLDAVSGKPSNLPERIDRLSRGLFGTTVTETIRSLYYQLLYGVAATISFSEKINAIAAVFVIFEFHSDSTAASKIRSNQKALYSFLKHLTGNRVKQINVGQLIGPLHVPGNQHFSGINPLYIGKIVRDVRTTNDFAKSKL
jgi:hypothetical protein